MVVGRSSQKGQLESCSRFLCNVKSMLMHFLAKQCDKFDTRLILAEHKDPHHIQNLLKILSCAY